jgi:hypothetical protein
MSFTHWPMAKDEGFNNEQCLRNFPLGDKNPLAIDVGFNIEECIRNFSLGKL